MGEPGLIAQHAGMVAFTIMLIGIAMGIWWKRREFKGSLSKGIGRSPFRRKPYDFDKHKPDKSERKDEQQSTDDSIKPPK